MNNLRLATLNLWNLKQWPERFPAIVDEINARKPDILLVQEAQVGASINQVEELARACSYEFFEHTPFTNKGEHSHGLGVLSRIPFTSTPRNHAHVRTEQRGFVQSSFAIEDKMIHVVNVHFDNTDTGSLIHLDEVLAHIAQSKFSTIIAGDFNCFDSQAVSKHSTATHTSSFDVAPYISYPDEGTLDYVLIPHSMNMTSCTCVERFLSDHRMIVVDIEIK
jgi:endonuclease/exonuclease/phosphatase family metal-dependent hydrolase